MPRLSTVDKLPPAIREAIGRLREHGKTIDEILQHLHDMEVDVSRSALGRHVKGMAAMGERLRRSRAMAEGLARQLGDTPGDKMARVNIELLHSFLNEAFAAADDDDEEEGAKAAALIKNPMGAKLFAEAIERLTKASRHNADFVAQIEKRASDHAKKDAAKAVDQVGKQRGLTQDTIAEIKASIFGVQA